MSTNKKVILINGDSTNWYEQAIFIVNKNVYEKNSINFVDEAEKIVNNYLFNKDETYFDNNKVLSKTNDIKVQSIIDDNNLSKIELPIKNLARKTKKLEFEIMLNYIMLISCVVVLIGISVSLYFS